MRYRTIAAGALLAAAAGAGWPPGEAPAQGVIPRGDLWVTDNSVVAIARAQGRLFAGGVYDYVGPTTGHLAAVDKGSGEIDEGYAAPNGTVLQVLSDGAGGWYLCGDFHAIDGIARDNVAHLLPDGTLDPGWSVEPDGTVEGMARSDETLYLWGSFAEINGVERYDVAALHAGTGALLPWDPAADGTVSHLALDGGFLLLCGNFSEIAGEPREGLAAFDPATGELLDWTGPGFSGVVNAAAFSEELIYLGGNFTSVGGESRRRIAAIERDTGALSSWDAYLVGSRVNALQLRGDTLFVGGSFDTLDAAYRRNLGAIDAITAEPFDWEADGTVLEVNSLHASGSVLYVGAQIAYPGDSEFIPFHALDAASGANLHSVPLVEFGMDVNAIAEDATRLLIGGRFRSAGGVSRNNLAALDEASGRALDWDPRPHGTVHAFAVSADSSIVYVGGQFDSISGFRRIDAAAYDASTLEILPWSPFVNQVYDIEPAGPLVYLCGLNFLRAVTASTGDSTAFKPAVNASVWSVAVAGDTVYAAGHFTTIAGVPRRGLAALDAATGAALAWDPMGAVGTGQFYDVKVHGGAVYLGSRDVDFIGGASRTLLSAVDRWSGLATPFNPVFSSLSGGDHVEDLFLHEGVVYATGDFSTNGRFGAAAYDAASGALLSWNPQIKGAGYSFAPGDGELFLGGAWDDIGPLNEHAVPNLASFSFDSVAPLGASALTATPHGSVDRRIDLAWTASPSPDVANYLVYRGVASLADTTGKLLAVTGAATGHADVTPAHATYFYRVFARDAAGNVGPPSNEASALSPDHGGGGGGGIAVTTAVFQNPALSAHADLVVAAVTALVSPPALTIELEPAGAPQAVALAAVPGTGDAWRGSYVFGAEGTYTLRTTVDAGAGDTVLTRALAVGFAREGEALALDTPDGGARLSLPAGAAPAGTCLLAQSGAEAGSFAFGPAIALAAAAAVELRFDARGTANPADLAIQARLPDGRWVSQPTTVIPERGVARASLAALAAVRLREAAGAGGATVLAGRPALRQNAPNPFRETTRIEFDLPLDGPAELAVYDVLGRRVRTLRGGMQSAGRHAVTWDGAGENGERVAHGIYFARLAAGSATRTVKLSLAP